MNYRVNIQRWRINGEIKKMNWCQQNQKPKTGKSSCLKKGKNLLKLKKKGGRSLKKFVTRATVN